MATKRPRSIEIDEDKVPPRIPIPRGLGAGPNRPGFMPLRLLILIDMIKKAFAPPVEKYHNIDYFAGKCAISKAFKAKGYGALDIILNPLDDINSPVGFIRHLYAACHIARGGLGCMGIVCSTWVAINRGTSGRTAEDPLGRTWYPSVARANLMLVRAVLIIHTILYHQGHWMLENPLSSIIDLAPRLATLMQHRVAHQTMTWLGMYGGTTQKPVKLFSSDKFVHRLYRKLERSRFPKSNTTIKYRNARGEWKFKGSDQLKVSQVYPPKFGQAVATEWDTWAVQYPKNRKVIDYSNDLWNDAKLDEVEAWLENHLANRANKRRVDLWEVEG
ncbi:unnamed protein product [Durusdinium trenchii]|uniref:Uncharacterized protein n=1 Tax=Durusdinium trenchii TaxID=1381693 RepID=A0ABP0IZ14_9DINO